MSSAVIRLDGVARDGELVLVPPKQRPELRELLGAVHFAAEERDARLAVRLQIACTSAMYLSVFTSLSEGSPPFAFLAGAPLSSAAFRLPASGVALALALPLGGAAASSSSSSRTTTSSASFGSSSSPSSPSSS
eukprot:CAMPEP_0195102496 /NCGR_PEP_ID=MMETSP0448-20130528/68030_1 /TAXON_ID=66468 /ORGANISM="Heterocapsa triquestra, Strain CCMP 448" /LENGTH=133 /DNA_ID=CAMNT_0040138003 /DNA_START=78 /DNA_END=478 /DNA_ORIENTATION=-